MRRSAILNHELAHIKRLDAFTQALANLAASVYWFHPLVWLMVRAMRAERERACDDHVLAAGTKASDYAHELLDIVSGLREPELAAALAMARKSQLEGRVLAVLNPALPRGSVSRRSALALAILTLCIVLPLSAMRPASQSITPAAKSGKAKPSPASTPAAAPRAQDSTTPATRDASQAPEARTPSADNDSEPAEPAEVAEAPEAPEPPETPEPPKRRSARTACDVPGRQCAGSSRGPRCTSRSRCSGGAGSPSGACCSRQRYQRLRDPRQAPQHEHGVEQRQ